MTSGLDPIHRCWPKAKAGTMADRLSASGYRVCYQLFQDF